MANLLFVVHGMGIHHPPGTGDDAQHDWCYDIQEKLDEIASHYEGFDMADFRFSKQVEIVPITYDEPFRNLLAGWNREAAELQKTIAEEGIKQAPSVIDWLAQVDGQAQETFFWSHVVDVLLYEFFNQVAKQIRLRVIDQILDAIAAARAKSPVLYVTFLAHSLGTAVLHDSLALLSTQTRASALEGPGFRFNALFMMANVSRILEDEIDPLRVYRSVVCPPNAMNRPRYFNNYWNVRHRLDPIPAVRPFGPVDWNSQYYRDIRLQNISRFNVHSFTHYLEDPEVHRPLISFAAGRSSLVPKGEPYRPPTLPCLQVMQEFERDARALMAMVQGQTTPFELIKAATQFLALAEKAKTACGRDSLDT